MGLQSMASGEGPLEEVHVGLIPNFKEKPKGIKLRF